MMILFGFLPIIFVVLGLNAYRALRQDHEVRQEPGDSQVTRGIQPNQPDGLFRLARRLGGRITLSDVVVETGMDMAKAERYMDSAEGVRNRGKRNWRCLPTVPRYCLSYNSPIAVYR